MASGNRNVFLYGSRNEEEKINLSQFTCVFHPNESSNSIIFRGETEYLAINSSSVLIWPKKRVILAGSADEN